ncbi:MAG: RNase H-like domain-containing protein, partial [Leuconostoc mesenteroides]
TLHLYNKVCNDSKLEFLGYKVSAKGILPSSSKIKAIQEWPRPTNVQEVRQFVGLAQHYRRFCPSFSSIAAPLTELTHGNGAKKRAIVWNAECETSFKAIKQMLTAPPLLKLPDMSQPYRIETDSSDFGVGAVLLQQDLSTSLWLPIAYESKKLSKAERKLPAQERELIAIIHALRTWRCFIDGCQGGYTVYSDHKPLIYFHSQVNPTPRLVRWIADYELFSPKIEYKAGKDNQVADALSRKPDLLIDDGVEIPSLKPEYLYAAWDQLSDQIKTDWPILYVDKNYEKMKSDVLRKRMEKEEDQFVVRQKTVYRKVKLESSKVLKLKFIPFSERADLVFKYHESFGHAGIKTMLKMFTERYWWPGFRKDILEWLKTCTACQLNSRRDQVHQDVMHPLQIPKAFDRWHLDFVGELPTTANGNKWLLTAVDYLTNWPIARAVSVASMEAVADFIYEEIVMRFGCPSEIITDRGANFNSGLVQAYTKRIGTNHKLTSTFHPRTNSKVERYNGVIKQMLRKYVNGAIHRWDDFVNAALWASRVRVHSTTGFSPFYLAYGREPRLPGDILRPYITREMLLDKRTVADITSRELELLGQHRAATEFRLEAMGEADKKRWDAKIKPTNFEIGDMVMLTHEGKFGLEPRFKGPYIVTKVFPNYGTYQLETIAGEPLQSLVHVDRIKAANGKKPLVPWYDPTASRRAVREAERLRLETNNFSGASSSLPSNHYSTSAVTPKQSLNQPPDDFIDMPVPNITNQNTPQIVENSTPNSIPEEDFSVHGSSIMDETENNDRVFEQLLDGYDFLSSADSDIEIPDQLLVPLSSSSTVSSVSSSSSYLPSAHPNNGILNEQINSNSNSDVDERVSEPEINEQMLNTELEESSTPKNIDPKNISSQSKNDHQNTEIVNSPPSNTTNLFPTTSIQETNITTTTSNQAPSGNFSFAPPPNQTKLSQTSAINAEKFIDLSSKMPLSNSTSKSSATVMTKSNDVQGRTSISKGGDVSISVV